MPCAAPFAENIRSPNKLSRLIKCIENYIKQRNPMLCIEIGWSSVCIANTHKFRYFQLCFNWTVHMCAPAYTPTQQQAWMVSNMVPDYLLNLFDIPILKYCTLIKLHLARLSNKSHGLLTMKLQRECFSIRVQTSIDSVFEIHCRRRDRLEIVQLWLNDDIISFNFVWY